MAESTPQNREDRDKPARKPEEFVKPDPLPEEDLENVSGGMTMVNNIDFDLRYDTVPKNK